MFYGQMGGKDLLKRKWKDLADFVTLECDGQNITNKLKELRVHAIVFLNIPRLVKIILPFQNVIQFKFTHISQSHNLYRFGGVKTIQTRGLW